MLFLIVGVVYERRHTREISEYGGLLKCDADLHDGLLHGGAQLHGDAAAQRIHRRNHDSAGRLSDVATWAFWGAVGIALGAAYLIWLFQRTMLGDVKEKNLRLEGPLAGAKSRSSRR